MQRALHYSHTLLAALIQRFPDGVYIDGTLGKGHDTAFILSQPGFCGQVMGFDIQDQALAWTQEAPQQGVRPAFPGLSRPNPYAVSGGPSIQWCHL